MLSHCHFPPTRRFDRVCSVTSTTSSIHKRFHAGLPLSQTTVPLYVAIDYFPLKRIPLAIRQALASSLLATAGTSWDRNEINRTFSVNRLHSVARSLQSPNGIERPLSTQSSRSLRRMSRSTGCRKQCFSVATQRQHYCFYLDFLTAVGSPVFSRQTLRRSSSSF